jgi:hypothetical protein
VASAGSPTYGVRSYKQERRATAPVNRGGKFTTAKIIVLLTLTRVSCEDYKTPEQTQFVKGGNMSRTCLGCFRLLAIEARTILFVLLFAVPLAAQRPGGPPGTPSNDPNDPINQEKTNKADMRNREWLMGNSRKPIRRAAWGPELAALPQINEDFQRIQLVDKDLMTAVFANNILDHKQIVKATADIEKRAGRLKGNLAYPEPGETPKTSLKTPNKTDIRLELSKLDSAIMSFVNNPIFKADRKVINAELAMKVSEDLTTVMKLSNSIRREAEALGKLQKGP